MEIFVDTNIFLRFLLADHSKQSPSCRKLFEKAKRNKITLITLPIVIAEIAWVLHSFYKETRKEVARKLKIILLFKGLEIAGRDGLIMAVEMFENKNIDFIDAYIASWLKQQKVKKICSYDKDYDRIDGIKRIEP